MLSSRYFRVLNYIFFWAQLFIGTPLRFNAETRQVYVTKTLYLRHSYGVFLLVLYSLYLHIRVVQYKLLGKSKDFSFFFLYALSVCSLADIIVCYPWIKKPKLAAWCINNFFKTLKEFNRK